MAFEADRTVCVQYGYLIPVLIDTPDMGICLCRQGAEYLHGFNGKGEQWYRCAIVGKGENGLQCGIGNGRVQGIETLLPFQRFRQ